MTAATLSPAASTHLLGNERYALMLTAAGTGYSHWKGLAVTRWRGDGLRHDGGSFIYLRDVRGGAVWSPTPQPCGDSARHWFDAGMARFARTDDTLTTTLEVAVDPEYPVEVRGIGLRNDGMLARDIELTSYMELVLGPMQADAAHPAFSKMFVQTAYENGVLLAWRRKREPSDPDMWVAHALVVDGAETAARQWESDRARFIGRDRSLHAPLAMQGDRRLSGSVGTVLDPIFALRARLRVRAGQTRRAVFVTAAGISHDEVAELIRRYLTPSACADLFARARKAAARESANGNSGELRGFQRVAGALLYDDPALRPAPDVIAKGEGSAPVLWAKGISGDLPIVSLSIDAAGQLGLVETLLRAQRFWRGRQLAADLVVLNEADAKQADALDDALRKAVAAAGEPGDKAGGSVFVLRGDQIDAKLRDGLATAARIVLKGGDGDFAAQLARAANRSGIAIANPRSQPPCGGKPTSAPEPATLDFWNGIGGFTRDGLEYVTVLSEGTSTPAPWSHIIANPDFGFLVTTTGGGYCWAINSQQNQITPWSNDAVCDPPGEVFRLRDEDDGTRWSVTASPWRVEGATYVARFGPGWARFDARIHDIESELLQCVATSDPVKLSRLRLHNCGRRKRRIAIAQTVEWMLGPIGSNPRPFTLVTQDAPRGAVFARNAWRNEFTQSVAFAACGADVVKTNSEGGPRSTLETIVELAPGDSAEITFLLGEGTDRDHALALVERYRCIDVGAVLTEVHGLWDGVLGALHVQTPERSVDLLVNRCLPYQVLACRLWARTAFYQASGAYGFRDQLQDVAALCIGRPDLARQHILLSASRQFEEGDVQHWWLPPSGKGVRTRIVDDRLWLPFVVAHYIETTGDAAILETDVPFLHGDALQEGQADAFFAPAESAAGGTLFEHCARAIDVSLAIGVHGLPLMGTGDWNDGMNRVGAGGKGESVWMAWFLARVIADFAPCAEDRRDARAARWRDHARALQLALETKAWDGDWYRRAFYDDGTPLGSAADEECRVESMAQSWSVISGAGDSERSVHAMQAVDAYLVRPQDGLVALFTPPFDKTPRDPGYIKGYPPGLRENGGQYTHGSIWSLIAFAMLGDGDKAGKLLEIFDPIRKSATPDKVSRYKVEPYVECADVYSIAPHVGRGGWTWYSGSAGWLYRAIVEWVLGFRLHGNCLRLEPCLPRRWRRFTLRYRFGKSTWEIEVCNPHAACRGIASIEVDGVPLADSHAGIALADDGAIHQVRVNMQKEPNR